MEAISEGVICFSYFWVAFTQHLVPVSNIPLSGLSPLIPQLEPTWNNNNLTLTYDKNRLTILQEFVCP